MKYLPDMLRNIRGHVALHAEDVKEGAGHCRVLSADAEFRKTSLMDVSNSYQRLMSVSEQPTIIPMYVQATEYLLAREIGELAETIKELADLQQKCRNLRLGNETTMRCIKEYEEATGEDFDFSLLKK